MCCATKRRSDNTQTLCNMTKTLCTLFIALLALGANNAFAQEPPQSDVLGVKLLAVKRKIWRFYAFFANFLPFGAYSMQKIAIFANGLCARAWHTTHPH